MISFVLVEGDIESFQDKSIGPQPFYVFFGQTHGNDEESKRLLKENVNWISHETVQLLTDYSVNADFDYVSAIHTVLLNNYMKEIFFRILF